MILVLLLLVVMVGLGAAGMVGVGVLSGDRRAERSGLVAAALSAPVVLVAGLLLIALLLVGVGGGGGQNADRPPATTTPTTVLPRAHLAQAADPLATVLILPDRENRFSDDRAVSGLVPGAVVRVQAAGYEWHERGRIELCAVELERQTACGDAFPVQFDGNGRAEFQFAVRGQLTSGGCRAGQPSCFLRLTGLDSGRTGGAQVVLLDQLGRGQVRVEPATGLADGQTVDVSVTGFPPGTTARAVLCAPPGPYDAHSCSAPGPSFALDTAGTGRTTLVVRTAVCGPRRACGITVLVGAGFVAAPVAPVSFTSGPGVDYTAGRVLTGVGLAALLVIAALVIAWRTDWTKPSEAATSELDASDLRTDQDLDDLFGTEEDLDARDPIPW